MSLLSEAEDGSNLLPRNICEYLLLQAAILQRLEYYSKPFLKTLTSQG
jgi:hypothetical protein